MVPGLILAAGRSTRMGRPKAFLTCPPEREPFVVALARRLLAGGTDGVLIVGRDDDDALRNLAETLGPGVRWVGNPHANAGGQLSSLIAGLDACDSPALRGVLMTPVDVPAVSADTVRALLAAFHRAPDRIVRAVHQGRHGHPVVFPRAVFAELRQADPSRGAKSVLHTHEVLDVEVLDAGVVQDIDTPEDYRRAFGD